MAANRECEITEEVLDQLLEGHYPAIVFESAGLVDELNKRLDAEQRDGAPSGARDR